jgi:DNA-binding Xre family transcriptional regulator
MMNKINFNKTKSLYEGGIKDKKFKAILEKEYKEFILSEFLISLMEDDNISVRILAKELDISPGTVQRIRSGKEKIKFETFLKIKDYFGLDVKIMKGNKILATI